MGGLNRLYYFTTLHLTSSMMFDDTIPYFHRSCVDKISERPMINDAYAKNRFASFTL